LKFFLKMNKLKHLYNQSNYFLTVQWVVLLLTSIFILNNTKEEAQLIANGFHSNFFDYFFYALTHAVEFWSCLVIYMLVALFKSYKTAFIGLLTYASSGLITQLLKRNFFTDHNRPTVNIENLRLIPEFFEYEQNSSFSFPSGHATAAFTLFLFLTLIVKNRYWGILFGILACLVAYSRVYLSQHYFIDIIVGSVIGTIVTLFSYYGFNKIRFGNWGDKNLLNKKKSDQ
jgi:membrane-associated phospholipid phosphatase